VSKENIPQRTTAPLSKQYHFIGIGGIGMSGIANLLLCRGIKVSGSDLKESKITGELKKLGAEIFIGHRAENIAGASLIVYSSAIREDNLEFREAKRLRIPLVKRAEALAELMQDKIVITVTGSHGKTTTTSLISYLLIEAGFNPDVAIGGILRNIDANSYFGNGKYFVAEADESDGSFLYYKPKYSIITNIDYEHLDYYKDFENEVGTFKQFLHKTDSLGCAFVCGDDLNLRGILKDYHKKYVLFGFKEGSDIYPRNVKINGLFAEFDCYYNDKFLERFSLSLGGEHNISNALAVIALGIELGIDLKVIKKSLYGYKGAKRRIEIKSQDDKCLVIDDYAHHPTEIKATLAAIKNLDPKRVIAVFQPHRYSRSKLLADEFGRSFSLADYVIITDIYSAGEPPQEGVTAQYILDKIKEHSPDKEIKFLPKEAIIGHILKVLKRGDLIITLGAGDITKTCDELVERIKGQG